MWPFNRTKRLAELSKSLEQCRYDNANLQRRVKDLSESLVKSQGASTRCQVRCDEQAAALDAVGVTKEGIDEYCQRKSRDLRTVTGRVAALTTQLSVARTAFTNVAKKLHATEAGLVKWENRAKRGIEVGYTAHEISGMSIRVRIGDTWFIFPEDTVKFQDLGWAVLSWPEQIPEQIRGTISWLIRQDVPDENGSRPAQYRWFDDE